MSGVLMFFLTSSTCQVFVIIAVTWMTLTTPFSNCVELDPCFSSPCHVNSECVPAPGKSGGYNCTCIEPYYGNGTFCTNPCKPNPCSNEETCNGTFENEVVGHKCYCDLNRFFYDTQGKCTCKYFCQSIDDDDGNDDDVYDNDDDYVFDPTTPVCTERCTHASYSCSNGHWFDSKGSCQEMDLCRPAKPCGPHGISCVSSLSAYNCTCRQGYTFNGTTCIDVDECENNSSICSGGGGGGDDDIHCVNTDGGYLCVCDVQNSIAVKDHNGHLHCLLINECGLYNAGCSQNCLDRNSGRQCSCLDGFHLNTDNRSCAFDEGGKYKPCTGANSLKCGVGGVCVILDGRNESRCLCFDGYKFNETSKTCEPVGNCDSIDNNCFNGGNCTQSAFQPGYLCSCPSGFKNGPLGRCYEQDICLQDPDICGENGHCVKVVGGGGYKCKCRPGYVLVTNVDGISKCTSIDYCGRSAVRQSCEVQGKLCRNFPGYYECYCPIPYYPRGSDGDTACIPPGNDAFIVVLEMFLFGSYFDNSYTGQRRMENTLKIHLFGSILPNYVDVKNIELTAFDIVSGSGAHIKANVFFGCHVPYLNDLLLETCANDTVGGGGCVLPPDLLVDRTTLARSISPYTMCYAESRLCGPLGKCIQSEHNYTCQCKTGYEVDGYVDRKKPICVDVDECNINPHICGSPSMRCVNIVGDFECECEECYYSNEDVTACVHVCAINPCKNDGRCSENRIGHNCGYSCRCTRDHYGPHCEFFNDELRSANTNTAITGGVLGGILLLILLVGGLVLFRNKKKGGYFE